jgi:type I restriction enzyme M protein
MAIKKSELYSKLWASCDELRGGMDASQYKDYVLVLLFIKYISDKYAGQPFAPITIPKGASFKDMAALKGKSDIGDQINKKIIAPLARENKLSDMPDFNDANKLGSGKEMVERLTNLIAIFEDPALDFSKNRADGDDILGDAYEYLMRHFATESGKSKGQFYTPAEVSRIMAQILGISTAKVTASTTVYDPACGSGSLLLKVGDEAGKSVTLYGQEKDAATSGLARMNMILHDNPTALIHQGNTLSDPKFKDGNNLKQFDYVVANPPFSDKRWSTGVDPFNDPYERFTSFGVPPAKQGDYAYLLHIVRSLKSTGKGACILPHGVLFRGNAEAEIRKNLIKKGYIKGIIGLPANLFYGTGIPACIIVIDKAGVADRKGIFMIDASQGFMKDGPKNRLRSQDIHKIVDVFNGEREIAKFSRLVPYAEIEKNEYNLNLPRYIDSQKAEDLQDIEGHLKGGIPLADVDTLSDYWRVCPKLRSDLFKDLRKGYVSLAVDKSAIKALIFEHQEFKAFVGSMNAHFDIWRAHASGQLKKLKKGVHPKDVIAELSEDLLKHYEGKALVDAYSVYQHLMDYWASTMQDDCYLIAADGWKAETYRILETKKSKDGKPGKQVDKGWTCDLVPKELIVSKFFAKELAELEAVTSEFESISSQIIELEEEYGGDEGILKGIESKKDLLDLFPEVILIALQEKDLNQHRLIQEQIATLKSLNSHITELSKSPAFSIDMFNKNGSLKVSAVRKYLKTSRNKVLAEAVEVSDRVNHLQRSLDTKIEELRAGYIKELDSNPDDPALKDFAVLKKYTALLNAKAACGERVKHLEASIDQQALARYPKLKESEVKGLVVDDKWMGAIQQSIHGDLDRISQSLTARVKELAERYESALPSLISEVTEREKKVRQHLQKMGFVW